MGKWVIRVGLTIAALGVLGLFAVGFEAVAVNHLPGMRWFWLAYLILMLGLVIGCVGAHLDE